MAKAAKRRPRKSKVDRGLPPRLVRIREETMEVVETLMRGRETYADVFARAVEALNHATWEEGKG